MNPIVYDVLAKHTYDDLPPDRSIFWSFGGSHSDPDTRQTTSINEELALAYLAIQNARRGDRHGFLPDHYRTLCLEILGDSYRRECRDLPQNPREFSYFETVFFWETVSRRFSEKSSGTITAAVHRTYAGSQFRRIELPLILANPFITKVRVLEGSPAGDLYYGVNKTTGEIVPAEDLSAVDWRQESRSWRESNYQIGRQYIPNEDLVVMDKTEWSSMMRRHWSEFHLNSLSFFLNLKDGDSRFPKTDGATRSYSEAIAFFISETDSLCKLLSDRLLQSKGMVTEEVKEVTELLKPFKALSETFPEIWFWNEPLTKLEKNFSISIKIADHTRRIRRLTQYLGSYFLKCDDSLTLEEKNRFWGRFESYRPYDYENKNSQYKDCFGNAEACEKYTREKMQTLHQALLSNPLLK